MPRRIGELPNIVAAIFLMAAFSASCEGSPMNKSGVQGASATTSGTTAVPSEWCVPISREAAIARVMKLSDEIAPSDTADAKLVDARHWAVRVVGSVTPAFAQDGHYAWGIFDVDAHSGEISGMTAGRASSAPTQWDSLVDHSASCAP
jgi:hypothetical protein